MRKRDSIVLLLICGFVLLNAGALYKGGSMRAKTLMCTVNMQKIGQGMAAYAEISDGRMPTMTGDGGTYMRAQWVVRARDFSTAPAEWLGLGCLFGAGYITDGRLFYCPAADGSNEEYLAYTNPAPWGSLPQVSNLATANEWVRVTKGYSYWPLATDNCTQAQYNAILNQPGGAAGFTLRYAVGYPLAPMKYSDLGTNRSLAFDFTIHRANTSGYNINVLFGDGHVKLSDIPRDDASGKYLYPYQQDTGIPPEERLAGGAPNPATWLQVFMYYYTSKLMP